MIRSVVNGLNKHDDRWRAVRFRRIAAERLVLSNWTQKIKCREFYELSIRVKQVDFRTKLKNLFFKKCASSLNASYFRAKLYYYRFFRSTMTLEGEDTFLRFDNRSTKIFLKKSLGVATFLLKRKVTDLETKLSGLSKKN